MNIKTKLILIAVLFLALPSFVGAAAVGQEAKFNIEPVYDLSNRKETTAVLNHISQELYFYIDKDWWQKLDYSKRQSLEVELYNLSIEFERNIYPKLTSTFGSEPKPGIDGDSRTTILIHPMIREAGGYFNSGDQYPRFMVPDSNQRNIIYLNSAHFFDKKIKSYLAHEFVHLITFNQKQKRFGVAEETWFNEARAEYAATLLGYDSDYKGSNLEQRVSAFLGSPTASLTEWQNKREDYGIVNLFIQYLVDHYGVKILTDSLQSSKTGIDSINFALERNGFKERFPQIFGSWAIAVLVNDCKMGAKYCYLNENLKNIRITPSFYYLPRTDTVLSTYHSATYWSVNWHRFVGGGSNFTLEFEGDSLIEFEVPYLLCDLKNSCSVSFLTLDAKQKGKINISGFSEKYNSLTIMPFVKSKVVGFDGRERTFSFSWKVSVSPKTEAEQEAKFIQQLLAQIEQLKKQIAEFQAKINAILTGSAPSSCHYFGNNLYFGIRNSPEVRCLQEFLAVQGAEIYPEQLITGNFLTLTRQAVIRFQEKYVLEILTPLGLQRGTGYVGIMTRAKINKLIKK